MQAAERVVLFNCREGRIHCAVSLKECETCGIEKAVQHVLFLPHLFHQPFSVIYKAKICRWQLLKTCIICHLSVLYYCTFNIFVFQTVCWTKQAVCRCDVWLWIVFLGFFHNFLTLNRLFVSWPHAGVLITTPPTPQLCNSFLLHRLNDELLCCKIFQSFER